MTVVDLPIEIFLTSNTHVSDMSKIIRISEGFYEVIEAHRRDDETMEETLRRLVGGPSPDVLAEIVEGGDEEAAEEMRRAIEAKREQGRERRAELRERFE